MNPDITTLVASALDISPDTLSPDSGPANVPEWDSLAHVTVITAAEKAYGVELTVKEMLSVQSIAKLRQVVEAKRG